MATPRNARPGMLLDPSASINNGLVGWWPMWEGCGAQAWDISGKNNHGTPINGPTWQDGGFRFDGTDDYINCGTMGSFGSQIAKSSFFCVFRNTSTALRAFTGAFNTGTVTGFSVEINEDQAGANVAGKFRLFLRDEAANYLMFSNTTAVSPNDGNWHTLSVITGVTETTGAIIYDGQSLPLTYNNTGTITNPANFAFPILLGARSNRATPDLFFPGSIRGARMWSRAISIREAQQLHVNPNIGLWVPDITRYYIPAAGGGFQPAWAANSNVLLGGGMAL